MCFPCFAPQKLWMKHTLTTASKNKSSNISLQCHITNIWIFLNVKITYTFKNVLRGIVSHNRGGYKNIRVFYILWMTHFFWTSVAQMFLSVVKSYFVMWYFWAAWPFLIITNLLCKNVRAINEADLNAYPWEVRLYLQKVDCSKQL